MEIQAEVSLYPLGESHLSGIIETFVEVVENHGCETEMGPMSTIVKGEASTVFEALRLGYERACESGGCVLTIKASNVCPA